MDKRIYFETMSGNVIDNHQVSQAIEIIYGDKIEPDDFELIRFHATNCKGIKKYIRNPSIEYMVKKGSIIHAVNICKWKNPNMPLSKCKEIVDNIRDNLWHTEKEGL